MNLKIRRCSKSDEKGIINVCFRTGFMGEDLTDTDRFNDKVLFGYLFCVYYPRYETENCFVAIDENNNIAGYILSTMDSKKQERLFIIRMGWRIIIRMLFCTVWKYPESLSSVIYFIRNSGYERENDEVLRQYPAHLHINVLPEYQHSGTGSMLMDALEKHLKDKGVRGVHLKTSNHNSKALPFYNKKGFKVINQKKDKLWSGIDDYESVLFGKKLID